jgi:hydroxymethylbilane synthase
MALAQSQQVADLITTATGRDVVLSGITTFGDVTQAELAQIGGTGVFVSALRRCLGAGDVDFAVHSLKDLPATDEPGFVVAAVPVRDDPRDALAARDGAKLADLPPGARIGTGSPRRAAQLRALRPDVVPVPVRGNAGTRLALIGSGDVDAVVLAYAGLARIGRLEVVTQIFEPQEMLPAPGQGALAVECRSADEAMVELLASVDDLASHAAAAAERSVLAALQAGCSAPVGGYAAATGGPGLLRLQAAVVSADGTASVRASADGPAADPARLGQQVATDLLSRGAAQYMDNSAGPPTSGDDDR